MYPIFLGYLSSEVSAPIEVTSPDEVRIVDVVSDNTTVKCPQVDEESLARRTAYLKQQRDKLLAMKKAEREKQLAEAEASQGSNRPKVLLLIVF